MALASLLMVLTRTADEIPMALPGGAGRRGEWLARLPTETFERLCLCWLREVGLTGLALRECWGTGLVEGTGVLPIGDTSSTVFVRFLADTRPTTAGDIRNLRLVLGRYGERGLHVTAGEATEDARIEAARSGEAPVLVVDGRQFLDCLIAAGDVVCHEPSDTWMVVDRSHPAPTAPITAHRASPIRLAG